MRTKNQSTVIFLPLFLCNQFCGGDSGFAIAVKVTRLCKFFRVSVTSQEVLEASLNLFGLCLRQLT